MSIRSPGVCASALKIHVVTLGTHRYYQNILQPILRTFVIICTPYCAPLSTFYFIYEVGGGLRQLFVFTVPKHVFC